MNERNRPAQAAGDAPRVARIVLGLVIVELTAATAYIHLSLGGVLFTLNGLGYLGLAAAYAAAAAIPTAIVHRYGWLPRIGLAGYALVTIGAYVVIGPYFALGWIAKGIEVAIIGLIVVDLLGTYGDPVSLARLVLGSVRLADTDRGPRRA
jgi:hypothetical protein